MADNAKLVTDELVAQVAEKLVAAGERVSNRAVWSAIGGGSMTTISAALRRWRDRVAIGGERPKLLIYRNNNLVLTTLRAAPAKAGKPRRA